MTRAVLPQLIVKRGGDIINISSTAGQKGAPVTSAYSASKFGLLGLTESLALEVRKHNIRVSALTPSTVATELAYKENLTDGNPEKVMQPEDLAEFIVAQLKLHPRVFIKSAGLWSTNPYLNCMEEKKGEQIFRLVSPFSSSSFSVRPKAAKC